MDDDTPTPQVHRVCNATELEPLTRAGWRLVRVLSESIPVPLQRTKHAFSPPYTPMGASYQVAGGFMPHVETHFEVGSVPLFLLSFDDTSIIGKQTGKLAELEAVIAKQQKAQEEFEKRQQFCSAQLADAQRLRELHGAEAVKWTSRLTELSVANRMLEADLGKVREVIGAKQMREILDGEEVSHRNQG